MLPRGLHCQVAGAPNPSTSICGEGEPSGVLTIEQTTLPLGSLLLIMDPPISDKDSSTSGNQIFESVLGP